METYAINGGRPLNGAVTIHGAKNSALPILAACVCCRGPVELSRCPAIADVDTALEILAHLGCRVWRRGDRVRVDASALCRCDVPTDLMAGMRSSVLFLGALLTRCGRAELAAPGGCALGCRPIDFHLWAMEQLGARWWCEGERLLCQAENPAGRHLAFRCPSVGATENALLAALGCPGTTVIDNAAREPEIADLVRFLRAMGADVAGEGTGRLTVEGGFPLHGGTYAVMADRMEAATYLCAAAGCGGRVFLRGARADCLPEVTDALERAGCRLRQTGEGLHLAAPERLEPPGSLVTRPYPGFPTDAQAPLMAAVLRAAGTTGFTETIFEDRLRHVDQLRRLGADIRQYGCRAVVRGVRRLHGADMAATDLRCGAALIIGALQAEGESRVAGVDHIRRGYQDLPETLRQLGADVRRNP